MREKLEHQVSEKLTELLLPFKVQATTLAFSEPVDLSARWLSLLKPMPIF